MMSRPAYIAFGVSFALCVLLALLAPVFGFFGFFASGILVLVLGVMGLVGTLLWGLLITSSEASSIKTVGSHVVFAACIGALAGALLFLPMVRVADFVVPLAKRPVRAMLAKRVVDRGRVAGRAQEDLSLSGMKGLLSDGGEITVYRQGTLVAVWFWDTRGILDSYSATVWVSDSSGHRLPANLRDTFEVHHVSGHWWTAGPD